MAGNGDIRQKIVLEGEREYSAALKEAQRNLKVLRSELKAETAELGKNATEQQKNEVRTKNLQKQIKEQEKVVKTYEKALAEVREKYGDNSEAIAKWEIKLNDARTALATMQRSVDDASNSMSKLGSAASESSAMGVVAMNSFADSLSKVGDLGDSVSSSLETAFGNVISVISDAISALWTDVMEVAGKANGWTDMAAMFGASTTEIQQWENTLKAAGKDFSVLGGMMTRLARGKTDKGITEWLGISSENYENELEYTLVLLQRLNEMKGTMSAADFNKKLTENFKGSESDIRWFLANYDYLMGKSEKYDAGEGGFGLSEERIEQLNEFYLKVNDIKTSWEALKDMALVKLTGDLALKVSGNVQNIIEAFKEYFDAEDDAGREAALQKIRDNIEQVFNAVREAIEEGIKALGKLAEELKKSDDPAVKAFGEVLNKLVDVLEWFSDENNWDTVKRGFEALIGVWATGKALKAISNIASFASHIMTIKNGGSWLFGNGAAGAASGGGAAAGGGTASAGSGIASGLAANGAWGLAPAGVLAAALLPAILQQRANEAKWQEKYEARTEAADLLEASGGGNADWIRRAAEAAVNTRMTDDPYEILMGLKDKNNQEKAELYRALMGTSAAGESAWGLLNQLWSGQGLDQNQVDELLNAVTDARIIYETMKLNGTNNPAKFSGDVLQYGSGWNYAYQGSDNYLWRIDENGEKVYMEIGYITDEMRKLNDLLDIPADSWNGSGEGIKTEVSDGAAEKIGNAVKSGVSGIRVYMDKVAVGHLVAPTVSQDIAYASGA